HTRRTPGEDAPAVSGDGAGGLCGPRGPGAAAVLRHPPAGHQPHRPRPDGAVRLPLRRAERPGGGSGEGGGHRGERGHPAVPGLPAQPEGPHSGRVPGDHPQLLRAGGGLSAGAICRRAAGTGLPAVPGPQGQAPGLQAAGGGG
ncbi:RNA polymerase sigma factor, partial [Dysosmobacter welbionis]